MADSTCPLGPHSDFTTFGHTITYILGTSREPGTVLDMGNTTESEAGSKCPHGIYSLVREMDIRK